MGLLGREILPAQVLRAERCEETRFRTEDLGAAGRQGKRGILQRDLFGEAQEFIDRHGQPHPGGIEQDLEAEDGAGIEVTRGAGDRLELVGDGFQRGTANGGQGVTQFGPDRLAPQTR